MSTSPFMNVKETAEYLQIHKITLYRIIKAKKIPHLRLGDGGKILFSKAEIDDFLCENGKYRKDLK